MNDYTKGILTGASLILCFFMFVSAKSQEKKVEFEDVVIKGSLLVGMEKTGKVMVTDGAIITFNYDGQISSIFGNGPNNGAARLEIKNHNRETISYVGASKGTGDGIISTNRSDGTMTTYLGASESGGGILEAYNKHGVKVLHAGEGAELHGAIVVFDRYGDIGWGETGKK